LEHQLAEQFGTSFRGYVLWARVQTAIQAVQQGRSLTQTCYEDGFADLPHFAKTNLLTRLHVLPAPSSPFAALL